jgi:hypothetical protein
MREKIPHVSVNAQLFSLEPRKVLS